MSDLHAWQALCITVMVLIPIITLLSERRDR